MVAAAEIAPPGKPTGRSDISFHFFPNKKLHHAPTWIGNFATEGMAAGVIFLIIGRSVVRAMRRVQEIKIDDN